ncbi:MAG: flavodoxin family protein [Firmicutes bacterium]|nr:flavodoxin family protein [Bacillota bacterium]
MNILMITGSPRKKGTTARLADAFAQGAESAGHRVAIYHAAFMDVVPCKACYGCKPEKNGCVIKDDMTPLLGDDGKLLKADAIVFVTPVYYFSMTAQLKAVLDRIYAIGRKMREKDQKILLITAAGDSDPAVMRGLDYQMRSLRDWTHWKDGGTLAALGCHEPEDLDGTNYLRKAYEMGYYI